MGDDYDGPAHPSLFSIQAGTTKTSQRDNPRYGVRLALGHAHYSWRPLFICRVRMKVKKYTNIHFGMSVRL